MKSPLNEKWNKALEKSFTIADAARSLGIPRSTLSDYAGRHSLAPGATTPDIRTIREKETRESKLQKELKLEKQKLKQAEEDLEKLRGQLGVVNQLKKVKPARIDKRPSKSSKGFAEAVLVCTDLHLGQVINPKTTNGLNAYNLEIAKKRLDAFWNNSIRMLDVARALVPIKSLRLAILGDLISGAIHEELLQTNEEGISKTVVRATNELIGGIEFLKNSAGFENIKVLCLAGNHGRSTKKISMATFMEDSWEYVIYQGIKRYFEQTSSVDIQIADGYMMYETIADHVVRLHHGHCVRGGVTTIGGIYTAYRKKIAQWNKSIQADLTISGHIHSFHRAKDFIISGALVGYDPFALQIGADYAHPSQTIFVVDNHKGVIFCEEIFVD